MRMYALLRVCVFFVLIALSLQHIVFVFHFVMTRRLTDLLCVPVAALPAQRKAAAPASRR